MHIFRDRAVDNVLVTMAARHPHLTTQKRFYAEIEWAHEGAELVTDGVAGLRAQLHPVTGERLVALEDIGEMPSDAPGCPNRTGEAVGINGKGSGRRRERHTFANRVTGSARAGAESELVAGPCTGRPAGVSPENPCGGTTAKFRQLCWLPWGPVRPPCVVADPSSTSRDGGCRPPPLHCRVAQMQGPGRNPRAVFTGHSRGILILRARPACSARHWVSNSAALWCGSRQRPVTVFPNMSS